MENFINFNNISLAESIAKFENGLKPYTSKDFVYIYLESDAPKNRLLLRNTIQKNGSLKTILVSGNKNLAELAWNANVFHFLHLSNNSLFAAIILLKDRMMAHYDSQEIPKKLKIPFKGGMDVIDTREICFCIGEGNYTTIFLTSGIKKTVTLQLNILEKKLCISPDFQRIGKSFIVSIGRISKIKENSVYFSTDKEPLKLNISDLYITRLKKAIMWY